MTSVTETTNPPVRKTINVSTSAERAFRVFTEGFDTWWPRSHSIGASALQKAVIETRLGGRCYQQSVDGTECDWGRILVWEPPHRFVMTWHPGRDPDVAQEVEVRFTPEGDATRVDLEHRNWQKLGKDAAKVRESYDGGWPGVLETFRIATQTDKGS